MNILQDLVSIDCFQQEDKIFFKIMNIPRLFLPLMQLLLLSQQYYQMSEEQQVIQNVNVKSKFFNINEQRTLKVSPASSKITLSQSGKPNEFKQFHVDEIQSHQEDGNTIKIALNNGRVYQVNSQEPQKITEALKNSKNIERTRKFIEQKSSMAPKSINYFQAYNPLKNAFNPLQAFVKNIQNPTTSNETVDPTDYPPINQATKTEEKIVNYVQAPYFLSDKDWKRDEKTGKVILLNQQWKKNSAKIVGFVVKKFVTTGSFMGISFPAFAMKPQSILESYAKSIGVAPKLFTGVHGNLQRMKNFISFIFTVSLLHIDIRKPFNPVIGETFQAKIAGGSYSAEQICHHPPISAFLYEGTDYKIYGQLQLSASIGVNSGQGRFIGDITVQFNDGYWIKGRIPNGELCGFVVGETYFQCYGGAYAYDSTNMVCTYQLGKEHIFEGVIGYLNEKYWKKFNQKLGKQERFIKFSRYPAEKYRQILSRFTVKVGFYVNFDDRQTFDFDYSKNLPYAPQEIDNQRLLLKSDSRFRNDIYQRKQFNVQKSQQEKQIIQNEERRYRKLREKYAN